ncbi:MAG: response regulator [Thermoplasmata archaeon]|nr:MAG: response regulator [Thermoplasmata archaeon]MCD6573651.1 response regulator [Thermoplasmata archaeon]
MKKIMVADDEPEIIDIIKKMLSGKYEVIGVYNGEEALKKAKEVKPDLILLDILMPKMDGWETLRKLKQDEELKNIPVSMLTALPLTPEDTFDKPIDDIENYIVKPFTKETLLKKIEDIFEREEEAKKKYEELKEKVGEDIANEYMKLSRAINRHRRLIGVIVNSTNQLNQSVRNLILSQKRLIESLKKRAEEIENLLEEEGNKSKKNISK